MADKPRLTDLPRRAKPLTQPLIPRAMLEDLKQKVKDTRRKRRAEAEKRKDW